MFFVEEDDDTLCRHHPRVQNNDLQTVPSSAVNNSDDVDGSTVPSLKRSLTSSSELNYQGTPAHCGNNTSPVAQCLQQKGINVSVMLRVEMSLFYRCIVNRTMINHALSYLATEVAQQVAVRMAMTRKNQHKKPLIKMYVLFD